MSSQSKLTLSTVSAFLVVFIAIYFFTVQDYWGMITVIPFGIIAALFRVYYKNNQQTPSDQNKIETETLANLADPKSIKHNKF